MKKTVIVSLGVISIFFITAAYFFLSDQAEAPIISESTEMVTWSDYNVQFSYPSGEKGLTAVNLPAEAIPTLQKSITLMPTLDAQAFMAEGLSEIPASIMVYVFAESSEGEVAERPDRMTRLQDWAQLNQTITAINLAKETPVVVDLDGLSALRYKSDGLYQQEVYLASYKENIYVLIGQYNDQSDEIVQQFQTLIDGVTFN